MIALIPAGILILAGFTVILLYQFRKGLGIPWLIAAIASVSAWVLTLVLHWITPLPLFLIGWNPIEKLTNILGFQLDLISWPFAFGLTSLIVAVIFTSSARLYQSTGPAVWGVNLIIAGFGFLTVIAATPLTIILTWTLIDLGELIILQRAIHQPDQMRAIIFSFSARLIGIFAIATALIISRAEGNVLSFSQISTRAGLLLFVGAIMRLGVLPRHLPYPQDFRFRRELGTILRSVEPASALAILVRLPDTFLPENWHFVVLALTSFAALYGAILFVSSRDDLEARPFWVIAVAGLAVASILRGHQVTALVWGLVLILIGGILGLYSARNVRIQYIPALAILGIIGLPFTPAAGGWLGLVNAPFDWFSPVYFIVHILLIIGLVKHLFSPGETYDQLERWIQAVYPAGLLMLIFSQWIIATWGWTGSYTVGVWWASIVPLVVIGVGYTLWMREIFARGFPGKVIAFLVRNRKIISGPLAGFFSLRWMYHLSKWTFLGLRWVVNGITLLLEGDGGILWVFLLLTMLITIIAPGGGV